MDEYSPLPAPSNIISDDDFLPALFNSVTEALVQVKAVAETILPLSVNHTVLSVPQHFHADRYYRDFLKARSRSAHAGVVTTILDAARNAGFGLSGPEHVRGMHYSIERAFRLDSCEGYGYHHGICHDEADSITVVVDYNDETLGLTLAEYSLASRYILLHSEYLKPLRADDQIAHDWMERAISDFLTECTDRFEIHPSQVEVAFLVGDGDEHGLTTLPSVMNKMLPNLRASTLNDIIPPYEVLATGAAQVAQTYFHNPDYFPTDWPSYTPYRRLKPHEAVNLGFRLPTRSDLADAYRSPWDDPLGGSCLREGDDDTSFYQFKFGSCDLS